MNIGVLKLAGYEVDYAGRSEKSGAWYWYRPGYPQIPEVHSTETDAWKSAWIDFLNSTREKPNK